VKTVIELILFINRLNGIRGPLHAALGRKERKPLP